MNISLFRMTPTVTVLDNRGLTVRTLQYHRHPDTPDTTGERITRHRYDARGFPARSTDPRLYDAGLANFSYQTDLVGNVLRTQGVDNGTTVSLNDPAGRPIIEVSNISTTDNGTGDRSHMVTRTWQYEDAALPGRTVSVTEQVTGKAARISERFVYAGNTNVEKGLNLSGVCVSHYDTAGLMQTDSIALTGAPLSVTRRLLKDADNPDAVADWQGEDVSLWNDMLGAETFTTLTTADATGAVLTTTDAKGNLQRVAYDLAGLLSGSWLTLKGGKEQTIVASLTYSAAGQKLHEVHGNGVVTTYTYEAETQRLTGIKTERLAGHTAGAKVLQDLRYKYDPVGNVLKVSNDSEETRFWRNQKVVPENTYTYDSLYQLVIATGREMANIGQQGSHLPKTTVPLPTDSTAYTNYTRTYTYDTAGNLMQVRHTPATGNGYTTRITVSNRSNRGVLSTLTENPAEVDALFTAGGQQVQLQPGQNLVWTPRNELLQVTPVVRDGDASDHESYRYGSSSQRVLKMSRQKTNNSVQTQQVLYLPGLELRNRTNGDTQTESLQSISIGEAGQAQVRVLHWTSGRPDGISNDQLRYSYDNLTGSSGLEVDGDGSIISTEEYYPYGGTAVWAARCVVEVNYKIVRYSGKERDATGLYYYGYRYYQPWVGRWLSADPAGTVDGLNLFRMVRNNPETLIDKNGLAPLNPVLGGFINDVLYDDNFNAIGYKEFVHNEAGHEYAPIAIWDNEIYVGTVNRHMAIRPQGKNRFPDFAGAIMGHTITNETGHYQTPDEPPEGMPTGYTYETHVGTTLSPIRMSMITSPENYINTVNDFRKEKDLNKRTKNLISYIKENNLFESMILQAKQYKNGHYVDLSRKAGVDIEKSVTEVLNDIRSENSNFYPSFVGREKRKEIEIKMIANNKKINAIESIIRNNDGLRLSPYSEISARVKGILNPACGSGALSTSNSRTVNTVTANAKKSSAFAKFRDSFRRKN